MTDESFTLTQEGANTVTRSKGNTDSLPVFLLKGIIPSGSSTYVSLKTNDEELRVVGPLAAGEDVYKRQGDSAEKSGGKFEKLGGILKGIGVAMGAVAVAAGTAAIKLGKEVISAYADYEQPVSYTHLLQQPPRPLPHQCL